MAKLCNALARITLLIYIAAHALVIVSLLAFGLRADGWVLQPIAVTWYGLFGVGSMILFIRSWKDDVSPWRLVIPPILMLAGLGAFPATSALGGATYAPYDLGDMNDTFLSLNVISALVIITLALLYRWPRLALAYATAQGLLLITYPTWWAMLWKWGNLGASALEVIIIAGLPLLYVLAARSLGMRMPPRSRRWILIGLALGSGLAIFAVIRQLAYLQERGLLPEETLNMLLGFAVEVPILLIFGVLFVSFLPRVRRMFRATTERDVRRFPWEALTLILLASASLSAQFLSLGQGLPPAGQVQGWVSSNHIVPDAWLPTIDWANGLFIVTLWLTIPYALLNMLNVLRFAHMRLRWPDYPALIVWAGMGWLLVDLCDHSPLGFPLHVTWEASLPGNDALPFVLGVLLVLAGRALERSRATWSNVFWRWLTFGGLLAALIWTGQIIYAYARILITPLQAWSVRWQYAPLPPILLVSIGLAVHITVLVLAVVALIKTLHAWLEAERLTGQRGASLLLRPLALPFLLLAIPIGLWWWATVPPVVRTIPTDGAIDVPRDTSILIEMGPIKSWLGTLLGGYGQGVRIHYADTGDYILGTSGGTGSGFFLDPDGLLRPSAPVDITVDRTGERPYTFRFTTAGENGPAATPIPDFPAFPAPMPTAVDR